MKCVAVLIWYDEDHRLLYENVRSWGEIADAVVAVDGAFKGYPGGKPWSRPIQREHIEHAAASQGMELLTYCPDHLWAGHAEKRSFALKLAESITGPEDWYLLMDADEQLVEGTREDLEAIDLDAGAVRAELHDAGHVWQPRLIRAVRGLRVEGLHYHYVAGDRTFWDYPGRKQEEWADTPFVLHHRRAERGPVRNAAAQAYYRHREQHRIEG